MSYLTFHTCIAFIIRNDIVLSIGENRKKKCKNTHYFHRIEAYLNWNGWTMWMTRLQSRYEKSHAIIFISNQIKNEWCKQFNIYFNVSFRLKLNVASILKWPLWMLYRWRNLTFVFEKPSQIKTEKKITKIKQFHKKQDRMRYGSICFLSSIFPF